MLETIGDTLEIYSMFHVTLKQEGVASLLVTVICTVLMMLMLEEQFKRICAIIDGVVSGH